MRHQKFILFFLYPTKKAYLIFHMGCWSRRTIEIYFILKFKSKLNFWNLTFMVNIFEIIKILILSDSLRFDLKKKRSLKESVVICRGIQS